MKKTITTVLLCLIGFNFIKAQNAAIAAGYTYGSAPGLTYGTFNYQAPGFRSNDNNLTPEQKKARLDSSLYFYIYPTMDDFFNNKKVFYGKAYEFDFGENGIKNFQDSEEKTLKLDSFGKKIKIKPTKMKLFGYQKGFMKYTNGWVDGESYIGGNKNLYVTSFGGSFIYDNEGFISKGQWYKAGKLLLLYYRSSDPKKSYTLEELVKDCPEVYNQYRTSKKEKRQKKNDAYEGTGVYFADQMKFFKMYINCTSKK